MGDDDLRDQELQAILQLTDPPIIGEALPGEERVGNSMPDLRASVKGWIFGQLVASGEIETRQQAADWLREEIYAPSRDVSGTPE